MQLDFFEVKEVIIKSNDKTYRGDIEIEKDEKGAILINVTGSVEVKIKAAVGMIQLVEGYCNHP